LKNQENNQNICPLAVNGSLEGEVVAIILGDEAEILGFPPTTHEIVRIPETRHKISKKHPDVDQGNIDRVHRQYQFQAVSKNDPACLERFCMLEDGWHVVVVKYGSGWNKLMTFHKVRIRDLKVRAREGWLLDRTLKTVTEDEII
jgi:hypothetical protein